MEKSATMDRITHNIQQLLDAHGMSHADLAEALGQKRPQVSRMLRGEHSPRVKYLEEIAEVFDVDVAVLFRPVRKNVAA